MAILYLGLLVVLPLSAVIAKGYGHGLSSLGGALRAPGAVDAIRLTLITSAIAAVVNGVFGTLIAYVLVRYRFPGRGALGTLVDMPFAIPTLVTGVMLVALYGPASPIGGFLVGHGIHVIFAKAGIVLALLVITLPLVVRTVQPVLLELDPAEEEAAHVLGANGFTTFLKVTLPHLRPAITAGALLAFARALGEFGAIVFVSGNIPNKTLTAPVFISQLINPTNYGGSGGPDQAAAISALLFGLSFVLVLVTERLVSSRSEGAAA